MPCNVSSMSNAAATAEISCPCPVHNDAVTIRVPAAMLVKPGAKRTTHRYVETVTHNLVDMNRMFGTYPVVAVA